MGTAPRLKARNGKNGVRASCANATSRTWRACTQRRHKMLLSAAVLLFDLSDTLAAAAYHRVQRAIQSASAPRAFGYARYAPCGAGKIDVVRVDNLITHGEMGCVPDRM